MSLPNGDDAGDLSELVRAGSAAKATMSMLSAIGSSISGSNQVLAQSAPGRASDTSHCDGGGALPSAMVSADANTTGRGLEATVASSSGRPNSCFGTTTTTTEPTSTSNRSSKRKRLHTEDSESPSEDAESESAAAARKHRRS